MEHVLTRQISAYPGGGYNVYTYIKNYVIAINESYQILCIHL